MWKRNEKKTIAERGLAFTFKKNDLKIMNENSLSQACAESSLLQVCVVLFSLLMRWGAANDLFSFYCYVYLVSRDAAS